MTEQLDLEDWLRENPKTLTEQYKKGELKVGQCYFVKLKNEKITPQMYSFVCIDGKHHCRDFGLCVGNVEEVLAPVPSYEEWQAKDEENKNLYKMLDVLNGHLDSLLKEDKENQQLKELLKECGNKIKEVTHILSKKPSIENTVTAHSILRKFMSEIDNAIGEKK